MNRQMGSIDDESVDDQHIFDLQQKINDLKAELDMSPRQFEDKLLQKLRHEIMISKEQMQDQLNQEMLMERQRVASKEMANKHQLRQHNQELREEVTKLKNAMKSNLPKQLKWFKS